MQHCYKALVTNFAFYNNNKHSLFTINHINYTIYLPKGRELRKMKTYKIEMKNKIWKPACQPSFNPTSHIPTFTSNHNGR